jgi:DNA polymerase type B, organellar and viral
MALKNRTRPLTYQKVKKKDETPICAFDFETRGLGGEFIIGAFATSDNIRNSFSNLNDCLHFILEHPKYRYLAHNASGYEFCYLYPVISEYFENNPDVELIPTLQGDSKVVQIRLVKGKQSIDLRDTLCLFGTSLSRVASAYCPDMPKGEPDWNEQHDNFDPSSHGWMSYLWRDCDIILVAYQKLRDMVWDTFECNIGVTAGRTAMNAFQTTIPPDTKYYRLSEYAEEFARKAYYGAAIFPGHTYGNWGETTSVDINGAYGFQMGIHEFPIGNAIRTLEYIPEYLGLYRVLVSVPKHLYTSLGFNPIPRKTKTGLIWEAGIFETYTTSVEIEWATRRGCTFEVLEGYIWLRAEKVFSEFITRCQQFELANNGAYKPAIKLLRNSCYGKFGTKGSHKELLFTHNGLPEEGCSPIINDRTGKEIDGLYTREQKTESPYIQPHWAAFITAYQRLYLFDFIELAYKNGASTVYCDTDSLKCSSSVISKLVADKLIPMGNLYGQFKIELQTNEFIMVAPKTYYMSDKEMKAKGMPYKTLSKEIYEETIQGKRSEKSFDAVKGLLEMVKTCDYHLPITRRRTITNINNSTAWQLADNGNIYPRGWLELDEEALYTNTS